MELASMLFFRYIIAENSKTKARASLPRRGFARTRHSGGSAGVRVTVRTSANCKKHANAQLLLHECIFRTAACQSKTKRAGILYAEPESIMASCNFQDSPSARYAAVIVSDYVCVCLLTGLSRARPPQPAGDPQPYFCYSP